MKKYWTILLLCSGILLLVYGMPDAKTGIANTKHNLSVTGPGDIKALTETRICVFCHTPHNATPRTPLWNKALDPINYDVYASSTLHVTPAQPTGPSRLCLSCHDGTVALGAVLSPAGGIEMSGAITPGRTSYFGTSLKGHHPFSFSYNSATINTEIVQIPPPGLHFYGSGNIVHCTTCHDPHDNTFGKFLLMDNRYSALCTQCHVKNGWPGTSHRSSTAFVNSVLPVAPRNWPTWTTVGEWGCEGCHTSHSAGGQQWLLYYSNEEDNCYPCHRGTVAQKNIYSQFQKLSTHAVAATAGLHSPIEAPLMITNHVECTDCHDPHASNSRPAVAPYVSGKLQNVSGVTMNAVATNPATYEYEICFKCHADATPSLLFYPGFPIPRVVNTTNLRWKFDLSNPSYHPVEAIGKNMNCPSLPSAYTPAITSSSIIYCTDCHDSNETPSIGGVGPRGPHGSVWPPILRERYDTLDNSMESFQTYALCYRCHNRDSILANQSFKKHQTHVVNDMAPCSVCHDAHGSRSDGGLTGDHTHLINFDARAVLPVSGQTYPLYKDNGNGTGSCTLVCHGHVHNPSSY